MSDERSDFLNGETAEEAFDRIMKEEEGGLSGLSSMLLTLARHIDELRKEMFHDRICAGISHYYADEKEGSKVDIGPDDHVVDTDEIVCTNPAAVDKSTQI